MFPTAVTPSGVIGLSRADKTRLIVEITATYVRARLALRRAPIERVVQDLRASDVEPLDLSDWNTYRSALRLAWAVERTLKYVPFDTRCLMKSLVLTSILARRGVATTLVIGVTPLPEFKAHAWVELEDRQLLSAGGEGEFERLHEL
jgi:hypothetical protein